MQTKIFYDGVIILWVFFILQAKNLTVAPGKAANGGLPDRMN